MAQSERIEYSCDKCGKKLKTCDNHMDIKTTLHENGYWSRLHVLIIHKHGMHNNGTEESADLCKKCAELLLADALARVRAGERASAGTEAIEKKEWRKS